MTAQSLLTVADWDLMPDDGNRYEIIEGAPYVSCAPSLFHQIVVTNFLVFFRLYLSQSPIGIVAPGPGVIFDEFNGVIPDVIFLSNERRAQVDTGQRLTGPPDLVIEVLSPGRDNERRDREVKRRLYAKFGVKEYWIASLENRTIEIYRLRDGTLEHTVTLDETQEISTELLPGFRCSVESIFRA